MTNEELLRSMVDLMEDRSDVKTNAIMGEVRSGFRDHGAKIAGVESRLTRIETILEGGVVPASICAEKEKGLDKRIAAVEDRQKGSSRLAWTAVFGAAIAFGAAFFKQLLAWIRP